ncbi:cytochrome c biogenesis protein ResB [Undibacterium squillarum]|uniref:cytochrome c biogenesis protein ResB n=1 Tax=Undibacterium squillarum TaxID=1131567 RepID=UPI0035AEE8E9
MLNMDNPLEHESAGDTAGIRLQTRNTVLADSVELLSSMRFAISLLVLICIGAVIGTVVKQNEPAPNYINQFGQFWYEVFDHAGVYSVYSAWWFLLMVGVLVLSTSLCVIRNAPKMLKDMRSWRENVREQSLRNFHHHAEYASAQDTVTLTERLSAYLQASGYQSKVVTKEDAVLIAAKRGAGNKWGYIFAHSAIVVIVLGAMLDSELPVKAQQWFLGKVPYDGSGNTLIAKIPEKHRLSERNPSFRGNAMIPEGGISNTAILSQQTGVLIQDLPVSVRLRQFHIEFYNTGMPKLFASDVTVTDHETGKSFDATIRVNQPLVYKGLAFYQSSFEDGGSRLRLKAWPMSGAQGQPFALRGEVGGSTPWAPPGQKAYNIEWSGFRVFNVEPVAKVTGEADKEKGLSRHLGSAAKSAESKEFRNVGPSIQYKLRDAAGQAREYMNFMQPSQIEGSTVFLSGMRESPADQFRFLRIPADDNDSPQEWMRIRAALQNPELRRLAAEKFTAHALPASLAGNPAMKEQMIASAVNTLALFAGDEKSAGYRAVSDYLEKKIPVAEQAKAADVMMKILNGSLWDLWMTAREKDGLPVLEADEKHGRFLQLSMAALSDAGFYGAPVYLQLESFDEVKATVLQITRSPGQGIVYFGCLLLVLGVFAMFYIRERRLWIWLKKGDAGSHILMAMSTQRKTLDFENEFEQCRTQLAEIADATETSLAPQGK